MVTEAKRIYECTEMQEKFFFPTMESKRGGRKKHRTIYINLVFEIVNYAV